VHSIYRFSQEVPISPHVESLYSDYLSMHPSPPKDTCRQMKRFDEESQEDQIFSIASSRPGPAKLLSQQDHLSVEGMDRPSMSASPQMGCGGWPGGNLSSWSSLPEGCSGNIWEFKTSHVVPCLPMERIGPDQGGLQLARAVVSFSVLCTIRTCCKCITERCVWARSCCLLFV